MISDFIYGGMDGVITTVAIIAGILGADMSPKYALILGMASLLADGFSMGISRYNSMVDVVRNKSNPIFSSLVTFVSFVFIGGIPFIPFLFTSVYDEVWIKKNMLYSSMFALFIIGVIKGVYTKKYFKSITEVFVIGLIGIMVSYHTAKYVKNHIV
jgi:hypothetical protein